MKDNLNKIDQDARTVYWIILEKLSIVLCLIIVFAGALALGLTLVGGRCHPRILVGTYRLWPLLFHLHTPAAKKTGRLMWVRLL